MASMTRSCGMLLSALLLAGCGAGAVAAEGPIESEQASFTLVTVASGLEHPWGMAFLPDGGLLITERPGRLRLLRDGELEADPISGVPEVVARGQGGPLDVALHPDFATNRWLYLSYAGPGADGAATTVARARLGAGALADLEVIFRALPDIGSSKHFASRLVFDRAGFLYVTAGERGQGARTQDLAQHPGSVLRLHDDGSAPEDNPFVGQTDAQPEIFSYGHRHPQGMALYTGDAFPEWQDHLFVGAFEDRLLALLELDGERMVGEERLLTGMIGRIRDVEIGPDGFVYLLTDESDGGLYRLEPAAGRDPA